MLFVKITNSHASKNRLQDYLSKQLKPLECLTVDDPEAFRKHLETMTHKANLRFPRCRPLVSYLHTAYTHGDYRAGVGEVVEFSLYAQRGVFEGVPAHVPITANEGVQSILFGD